jgi:hypothetical protein
MIELPMTAKIAINKNNFLLPANRKNHDILLPLPQ